MFTINMPLLPDDAALEVVQHAELNKYGSQSVYLNYANRDTQVTMAHRVCTSLKPTGTHR